MDIKMPTNIEAIGMISEGARGTSSASSGGDFLNLLASLLSKGSDGEDALVNLLNSGSFSEGESLLGSNGEGLVGETGNTISSLMKILNLKINGEESGLQRDNFIVNNLDIENVLAGLKDLSTNSSLENLSQYINGVNEGNGFLQLKAMHNLNLQAQNSNIASTLQGMILNYSGSNENKDVLNALKFLQQFTTEDGGLDTGSLVKAIESKGKGQDASSFMGSMSLMQEHISGSSEITKEVSIFKNRDIVDVVVENFKTLRLPGRCEMTIKLNPKELGEITIKLVLEKGQISAAVTANKRETVNILQNNINNLIDQLKDSGTDIQHISINLSQEQNGEEARRGYKRDKENKDDDEFENIFDDISSEDELINSLI